MANEIFLSYSRADWPVADRVRAFLEENGFSCWIAPRDILEGQDFGAAIAAAIQGCRVVVLIFSSATNTSKQVGRELKLADDANKAVVPLRIENVAPTGNFAYFMGAAHWLDAIGGPREPDLQRLATSLQKYIQPAAATSEVSPSIVIPGAIPVAEPRRRAYVVYSGLGVALLLAAGGVWWFTMKARPSKANAPGTVRLNAADGQKYVWIPAGSFRMGCSDNDRECDATEKPSHEVRIGKGFWLGQTEVTVAAYREFAQQTGRSVPGAPSFRQRGEDYPVVGVSWPEAATYCKNWVRGRLPTEAEWEYAARAGTSGPRYAELDAIAWYRGNSGGVAHPVMQKTPNNWKLYDMLGSVWEWCSDWVAPFSSNPVVDPQGPANGTLRIGRGGSFAHEPNMIRVSVRGGNSPDAPDANLGFRCICESIVER